MNLQNLLWTFSKTAVSILRALLNIFVYSEIQISDESVIIGLIVESNSFNNSVGLSAVPVNRQDLSRKEAQSALSYNSLTAGFKDPFLLKYSPRYL